MGNITKGLLAVSIIGILYLLYKAKGKQVSNVVTTKPSTNSVLPIKPTKPNKPQSQPQPQSTSNQSLSQTFNQGNLNQPSQQANTNPLLLSQLQQAGQQVSTFTSGMGNASMYDLFSPNYYAPTSQMESNVASDAMYSWQGWVDQQNTIREQNYINQYGDAAAQFAINQVLSGDTSNYQYSLYTLPSGGYGMFITDAGFGGGNSQERCPRGWIMGNSNICEWVGS